MTDKNYDVEQTIERVIDIVLFDNVPNHNEFEEGEHACAVHWAILRGNGEWVPNIHERDPLAVLDELGTDVPNEWNDYAGAVDHGYVESETVLEAMARRQLEEEIYERLQEYDQETSEEDDINGGFATRLGRAFEDNEGVWVDGDRERIAVWYGHATVNVYDAQSYRYMRTIEIQVAHTADDQETIENAVHCRLTQDDYVRDGRSAAADTKVQA